MKRMLWIVTLMIALSSTAFAQRAADKSQAASDRVAQELEQFRQATVTAFQNNDVAALDRLLADNLIGTGEAGVAYDKAALMGLIKSGQLKYETVEIEPSRSNRHGDVVVISSTVKTRLQFAGQAVRQLSRTTTVAEKRQGRWQYTAIHSTPILSPPQQAEQELKQAVEEIRRAILAGDAATWERMVLDNWQFISVDGEVGQPKAAVTAGFKNGALKFDAYEFADLKIQSLGNTAMTTLTLTARGRNGEAAINDRVRAASLWARGPQGDWRLIATQQTRITRPKP